MVNRRPLILQLALGAAFVLLGAIQGWGTSPYEVPVRNPDFSDKLDAKGIPAGWSRYGSGGQEQDLNVVDAPGGGKALRIADGNPQAETGVCQIIPLKAGETYRASVRVCALENASVGGAYLQFRFVPSQQFFQAGLAAESTKAFSEISVEGTAPPGTTQGIVYVYTHREPTPKVLVTGVRVLGGLPPPPPPPPEPVPPQYTKLADPHRTLRLVQDGKPNAAIVVPQKEAYQAGALAIQGEIERRTGVKLPILPDVSPEAALPLHRHLIALGNRSTNRTLRALYDQFYCLADLKYPGPGGYSIRSVHNPSGDGHSVVIVGASNDSGLAEGVTKLVGILSGANASKGDLSIGWILETKLGRGVKPPTDIKQFETWEASKNYGSIGYFGWTSISKRMAMYYMTGDEFSAREVVRLSFPDAKALKEIEEIDGERIENKHDPLAGFYHYNAHMAILFWDLIEESPAFTDAERLKITNAFARQLNHRKGEGVYGLTQAPSHGVGSRHGQWSAISLYCLGRYFNKAYPDPVWAQCVRGGELAFHSLHQHAWVAGESDNLFWYNTGLAPILTYMVLTGDRKPLENGVLGELLRGQDILISGRVPDWALNSAALDFLNKAAYLTGDGRWLTYRERTGVDPNVFRLGQSFWPDPDREPALPSDLAGKWSVHRLPKPAWEARDSGLPRDRSFYFASFRSAPDGTGDFILLDGFNGASRNPYHTFDILELRLAGRTILQGYHNQITTRADGMVEPAVAMDASLLFQNVVGETAVAVGEVPRAAFCNWRRAICQRAGRYALIVDDLTFRTDSQNMKVATTWQVPGGSWDSKEQAIRLPAVRAGSTGDSSFELRSCDLQEVSRAEAVTMSWNGAVTKGGKRLAFSLIAPKPAKSSNAPSCLRVAPNAAALGLPQKALAVVGETGPIRGELTVLAEDHLFGHAVTRAGIGSVGILSSDVPVEVDWDFSKGVANVVAEAAAKLQLGDRVCSLAPGRHALTGVFLSPQTASQLLAGLQDSLAAGQKQRAEDLVRSGATPPLTLPEWSPAFTVNMGAKVTALVPMVGSGGVEVAIAEGTSIHVLTALGQERQKFQTDGPVRVLRWWDETQLLLAGCADEKVIAFDRDGRRAWTFTSEMDPAVYEAAKTYWFKSAPGHEGIHGLFTGTFDEGKTRCFVGSACTLEILDTAGKLVKRTPVFWGPCWKFLMTAASDGSPNLLVAQWPNGGDGLAIVSSKTLTDTGHGFEGVPSGHSFVGGWTAQNRTGLFRADLEGDGTPEVVTGINGTWNRVTIYSEAGKPLFNAQFGPGANSAPRSRMRDMSVSDLNGDGKQEIVVGLDEGLVVALDGACGKLWSTRLPSPPVSVRSKAGQVVAGCEDGRLFVLDTGGREIRLGRVNGRPSWMETIEGSNGRMLVVATDQGVVQGFRIAD